MAFDSLKRLFGFSKGSKQQEIVSRVNRIDDEIDMYEKEIQEYLRYQNMKKGPASPGGSQVLSQGGGMTMGGGSRGAVADNDVPGGQPAARRSTQSPDKPEKETATQAEATIPGPADEGSKKEASPGKLKE